MDIVKRAKGLILRPAEEWALIAAEPADTRSLFLGYAVPLAAIPAVAGFVGLLLFAGLLGTSYGVRISPLPLLLNAVAGYVLGLAGVWVWGRIIAALAPRFGGTADGTAAMKLAVHTPTAAWLAGSFALLPPLAILGVLGLYSLYIFWKGVPLLARVPDDKRLVFTIAVLVIGFIVNVLAALVAGFFVSV